MKLYIKQKVFSWSDRFAIKDEGERDRWFAQGEIFALGRKLHVYDAGGTERAFIRGKVLTWLPRYYIEIAGKKYEFVKELSLLKPKFSIRNLGWTVSGDFFAHDYAVLSGRGEEMRITKEWLSWGDTYALDIANENNELLCLCIVLAIDCINADAAARSSN